MNSLSHLTGGAALAVGFSFASNQPELGFIAGAIAGSKAPDWLEFPRRFFGSVRVGILPHRTITHWFMLWASMLAFLLTFEPSIVVLVLLGFFAGGIIHLIQDACTPMGVQFILPFNNRITFNLVHGLASEIIVNVMLLPMFFVIGYALAILKLGS